MNKVAVIGAGKTGRGFLGRLLREADQEILFVDRDLCLVNALNRAGGFRVHFFGGRRDPLQIDHFRACTWEDAVFDEVELILVSVGGDNLADVGRSLSKRLDPGRHYYIITGENAARPAATLREAAGAANISVSESTVFCTTVEGEGLDIRSEDYPYLQCDAKPLGGYTPDVPQIRPLERFGDFLTRKLYTYNAASCVIAYLGWVKGYEDYGDAANDPEILALLDRNYEATNRVLCKEFGYAAADQEEFALLSRKKFCDRTITDTVARNARDPQRKLKPCERIIGPIRLFYKYGEDASVMEQTAAAAVLYRAAFGAPFTAVQSEKGAEGTLVDICGLSPREEMFANIMKYIEKIKSKTLFSTYCGFSSDTSGCKNVY